MTELYLPMNVKYSCDLVMNSVRDSSLIYSMTETPFSLYLTTKKTFMRSSSTFDQSSSASLNNISAAAPDNITKIEDLPPSFFLFQAAYLLFSFLSSS